MMMRRWKTLVTAIVLVGGVTGAGTGCTTTGSSSTEAPGAPAGMSRFRASDGLYAVPQLMQHKPSADLSDTTFWVAARSLASGGPVVLAASAATQLTPLINDDPSIDRLMMATLLRDHTGTDLASGPLVEAVAHEQDASGFFAPTAMPASERTPAALVDQSYRAALGLATRDTTATWRPRLVAAARSVLPSTLTTRYSRYQLAYLQALSGPAAGSVGATVDATPPASPDQSEHLFDLLAEARAGDRLDDSSATRWLEWVRSARPSAAETYVVAQALSSAHAPTPILHQLAEVVGELAAPYERGDGTYHAQFDTAGDLKASYLFLVAARLSSGRAWRDQPLVDAVTRMAPPAGNDPYAAWEAFLRARVTELASDGSRVTSLEVHPAWQSELSQNVRSLPENVVLAIDAGVVVPTLWKPETVDGPGPLAHLYVANWLARSATPAVSGPVLDGWRQELGSPPSDVSNRELFTVATALMLADPRGSTETVRGLADRRMATDGNCGDVPFLVTSSSADSSCDLQASLAAAVMHTALDGGSLEHALE